MKFKWADSIAVIFFVLFVGVFFRQTLFEGKLPVPSDALVGLYHPWRDLYSDAYPRGAPFKNFLITDPVRQQIPWRKVVIDQWKEGKIPSWNPYNFSGVPLVGNIQAAAFYPLNVLFFIFDFVNAWTILILLQPLLAGIFFYAYVRSLGIQPLASLVGAMAWSFSGFNIAWLTWGTMGHVALWLPLALLAIDRMFVLGPPSSRDRSDGDAISHQCEIASSKTPRNDKITWWSTLFVASMTFQLFAGHAQISFYFILVIIAYTVMRKRAGLRFILLLGLVALITSIQWIPFLDLVRQSGRVAGSADFTKEGWFIPWAHLVQFVAPDFFGNPTTLNYWGQWNYGEFVGYIGILPLMFAFIAIFSPSLKKHRFWIGASAVALLLVLPTPISVLPFILKVPIFSSLQPTRLLFIVDFALAVLAAYGCHEFFESSKKIHWYRVIVFVGIILAILWGIVVVGSLEVSRNNLVLPTTLFFAVTILFAIYVRKFHVTKFGSIVTYGMVGLVAVDLLRFGWKFTPFTAREYFFPETKVISFFKEQTQPFRVMSIDKRILPPNTASYFGIESIEGYDPIISSRYEELMAAIARGKPDIAPPFGFNRIVSLEVPMAKLVPLLGARYILSLSALTEPYLTKVFEEGETKVYEDTRAMPRAYLVERLVPVSGKEEAIAKLYVSDIRLEAVVEGNPEVISVPLQSSESVIMRYKPTIIEMDVRVGVPRFLVISNTYDRGWKARVDGKETPIYRTNYAFQGIVVPEGTHSVVFSYTL